jgi:hypothetical protein
MGRLALVEVGRPQRQLVGDDLAGAIRELKAEDVIRLAYVPA